METEIVRVTSENSNILDSVAEGVFDAEIQPDLLAAYLADPKNFMFVAVSNGVVIGQARGMNHLHPDAATELYIDNLGVAPSHQRKGIATALMQALIASGTNDKVTEIWLGTEQDNAQAVGFYRSMKLNETNIVMFANFDDA